MSIWTARAEERVYEAYGIACTQQQYEMLRASGKTLLRALATPPAPRRESETAFFGRLCGVPNRLFGAYLLPDGDAT